MLDVQSTYEVRMLDAMLEQNPSCEARTHGHHVCTEEVIARGSYECQPREVNACSAAVAYVVRSWEWGVICADCGRDCADCWKIIPI